jgi:hypothetical protein
MIIMFMCVCVHVCVYVYVCVSRRRACAFQWGSVGQSELAGCALKDALGGVTARMP